MAEYPARDWTWGYAYNIMGYISEPENSRFYIYTDMPEAHEIFIFDEFHICNYRARKKSAWTAISETTVSISVFLIIFCLCPRSGGSNSDIKRALRANTYENLLKLHLGSTEMFTWEHDSTITVLWVRMCGSYGRQIGRQDDQGGQSQSQGPRPRPKYGLCHASPSVKKESQVIVSKNCKKSGNLTGMTQNIAEKVVCESLQKVRLPD
jgi:hypothetical protein